MLLKTVTPWQQEIYFYILQSDKRHKNTRSNALTENGSANNMAIHRNCVKSRHGWNSVSSSKFRTLGCKTITGLVGGWVITDSFLWIFNIVKYCQTLLTCLLVYHGINSVGTVQGRNTLRWAGQRRADTAWRLVITPGTGAGIITTDQESLQIIVISA